ncbi:hypothetical protein TRFO_36706 [Tritrichomonas foetus]|uniref:Uncharacterized protein n=1 Tax=Tritrichomonas foetus TaxID=1144522 RepID=A0A1J4JIV4_9EUKA|nr:hypothetical protein TRFO_36706 [Tritrichomonas foetus]|eukprot:OHS97148.1 hypothetical protein TRFO_36706 [Tritrichomonas foetus]
MISDFSKKCNFFFQCRESDTSQKLNWRWILLNSFYIISKSYFMEEDQSYDSTKVFRVFTLYRQTFSHIRISMLPLSITFTLEAIKELKYFYQSVIDAIYALFNSGSESLKAIAGAWSIAPLLLLFLFAIVGNKGIEQLRHLSMVSLVGLTFACFNVFLEVSYLMLLIQLATIGFYILLAFLAKRRNWRLILDVIFSGITLLFMIYYEKATFASTTFIAVCWSCFICIVLYIFFGIFTCWYRRICCHKLDIKKHDDPLERVLEIKNSINTFVLSDVEGLATQDTHYFFWTMMWLGSVFMVVTGIIIGLMSLFLKDSEDMKIFVYIFLPTGTIPLIIFIIIHYSDHCSNNPLHKRIIRRGMVTRYTLKLVYLIIDYLSLPLMRAVVETFYDKTILKGTIAQFGILACFAQFIAIPIIHFVSLHKTAEMLDVIDADSNLPIEDLWERNVENIPSSTLANFETYSKDFCYWYIVSLFYELLNTIFSVIYDHEPKAFYGAFILHIIMLVVYCIFRPSFYLVHNATSIASYAINVVEDITVILKMNGKTSITDSVIFILVVMFLPFATFIVTAIIKVFDCTKKKMKISKNEQKQFKTIGIFLDDQAFNVVSIWALHMIGCGVGLLMISMPNDMNLNLGKAWIGVGVVETILFCIAWLYSLNRSTTKLNKADLYEYYMKIFNKKLRIDGIQKSNEADQKSEEEDDEQSQEQMKKKPELVI